MVDQAIEEFDGVGYPKIYTRRASKGSVKTR